MDNSHFKMFRRSSRPLGRPRKPKQSGRALWVGNLHARISLMTARDYFSKGATDDIESLFLISKGSCAFVNYRPEAACEVALRRFHRSLFHGRAVVCRVRRDQASPSPGATPPSSASLSTSSPPPLSPASSLGAEPKSPLIVSGNSPLDI